MSDEQKLMRLFDALADSVEEMTDEEILAEARETGDPKVQAARVADIVEKSVRAHSERRRLEARRQYEAAIEAMSRRGYTLPPTAEERRTLLVAAVTGNPGIRSAVTLQHRELKTLTDEDVAGYLKKLIELGLLGGEDEGEK
jgi:hypothetical protein